jgi:hypothetical protein
MFFVAGVWFSVNIIAKHWKSLITVALKALSGAGLRKILTFSLGIITLHSVVTVCTFIYSQSDQ